MDVFYREGYTGIEMEAGPYLSAVYEMFRSTRHPIDEIVKIPVKKRISLPINSFWYFETKREMLPESPKGPVRIDPTLDPLKDGYCITRSAKQGRNVIGFSGSDYNIVHCKWKLTYQICDSERYFKNIYKDIIILSLLMLL